MGHIQFKEVFLRKDKLMYTLLLLNGGLGSRFGGGEPKQLVRINQIPMFIYSLRAALSVSAISRIVINYPSGWKPTFKHLLRDYGLLERVEMTSAGSSRQDSVRKMLDYVKDDKNQLVLIHEAARPLVDEADFQKLIDFGGENVGFSIEIPFTVLELDEGKSCLQKSLDRNLLCNVQLPQKFNRDSLYKAHKRAASDNVSFTEDASLIHHYGEKMQFIEGFPENIKVTNSIDRRIAEFLFDEKNRHHDE